MIIVSQNKESIYNFNNIKSIDVIKNEIYLDDIISDYIGTKIAEYETEERAKEILKEICLNYEKWKNLEVFNGNIEIGFSRPVYEMPKE